MKTCKCGMPIYDEPGQRYDKCYLCMVKSLRTAVEKRLFTGMNIKDKPIELFPGFKIKTLRFPSFLWFKYIWLKHILRRPIQGFIGDVPIFLDENLEEDKPNVVGNAEL